MSETIAPLPEEMPRAEVIRILERWSADRGHREGDPAGGRRESAALVDIKEGVVGAWTNLCEVLHGSGLAQLMLMTRPGLWSQCRLAAGPAWNGIPTMTRGLIRHLSAIPSWSMGAGDRRWPYGVGCVAVADDTLWIADHLLYACQDDLEIGLDCRFYGCSRDPDLSGIADHRWRWSWVQRRWITKIAGALTPGWLSSPRWMFPVPAHAIPRSALTDPLGQRLWRAGVEVSSLCTATAESAPRLWWADPSLVPTASMASWWASSERRTGYGIMSLDGIVARTVHDPAAIPALLAGMAPGESVPEQRAWRLIERLVNQFWLSVETQPSTDGEDRLRVHQPLPFGPHRVWIERGEKWIAVNTWALSRALQQAALVPSYHHLQGLTEWPPSTLLRSGLGEILLAHAAPVIPTQPHGDPGNFPQGKYPGLGPRGDSRWFPPDTNWSTVKHSGQQSAGRDGSKPKAGRPMNLFRDASLSD